MKTYITLFLIWLIAVLVLEITAQHSQKTALKTSLEKARNVLNQPRPCEVKLGRETHVFQHCKILEEV